MENTRGNKKVIILLMLFSIFILLVLAIAIAILLKRQSEEESQDQEIVEGTSEEIVRESYGGLYPVSGELIEVDEERIKIKVDDEEQIYDLAQDIACKQIGKPGQICEDLEGEGCDLVPIDCEVSSIDIEQSLRVDIDLNSDEEVKNLRVHYIAH